MNLDATSVPAESAPPSPPRALTVGGATLLAAVAIATRLYRFPDVPPGIHGDESTNGIDILFTLPKGLTPFLERNNGRESLFIYLQAAFVAVLGGDIAPLRLAAVCVGLATVGATYWLGARWLGRFGGLLAALGLATSYWHIGLSRIGFRAGAAPLVVCLALVCLWHATRRDRSWGWAVACGASVGLGCYVYLSLRVLPLLIAGALLGSMVAGALSPRQALRVLAVVAATAALVAIPLALYFVGHPAQLLLRSQQVSVLAAKPEIEVEPVGWRENVVRNLGVVFVQGEPKDRFNIPGRPVLAPVLAPAFALGLVVAGAAVPFALARRRRESWRGDGGPGRTEAATWLVGWLVVALLPGVLAQESPSFIRLSAMAPAVYLTAALGLTLVVAEVRRRWPARAWLRSVVAGAALLLVLVEGAIGIRDYFVVWAPSPATYQAYDASLTALARDLTAMHADAETPGYSGSGIPEPAPRSGLVLDVAYHRFPTLVYLSPGARTARWLQPEGDLLVLPGAEADAPVTVVVSDAALQRIGASPLAALAPDVNRSDGYGAPAYRIYSLHPARLADLRQPPVASARQFGQVAKLVGVRFGSDAPRAGTPVAVTATWQLTADTPQILGPYAHFVDERGRKWAQSDRSGATVGGWRRGDVVVSRHEWVLPADTPPLGFTVLLGMTTRGVQWPPGDVEPLGPPEPVGTVFVAAPPIGATPPRPADPTRIPSLVRAEGVPDVRLPGQSVDFDLIWAGPAGRMPDWLLGLRLIDATGAVIAEDVSAPAYGHYPTSAWPDGALVRDPRRLSVPGRASGTLQLEAVVKTAASGPIAAVTPLGTIVVAASERSFELPRMGHTVGKDFGGEIRLAGYDLAPERARPGSPLRLRLYWQAGRQPARNYTVFTHLLDESDRVVGQMDGQPDRGRAPTLGWVEGQVIVDEYELTLDSASRAGELTLEVGLYDASTGQRLTLTDGSGDRLVLARLPVDR